MHNLRLLLCLASAFVMTAYADKTLTVTVSNPDKAERNAQPVVIDLDDYDDVREAIVTCNGTEIPSQLDDLDDDDEYDELCFMADLKGKETKTFKVELKDRGTQKAYEPQVYADMLISDKKVKQSNKHRLYISELAVDNGTNPYNMLHHHGPAFENKLVAYRIYFDHRQTIDIYGKYSKQLELKETQFYPDNDQKAAGYGDDCLWVGETFGLGALRGWDGNAPQMLKDVDRRKMRLVSRGPVRVIVEVEDKGWNTMNPGKEKIDARLRYTLYADRRDLSIEVKIKARKAPLSISPEGEKRSASAVKGASTPSPSGEGRGEGLYQFATGLINVKNSVEYSDKKGLRACWGTDWPVSEKDSAGHKRETVGLAILVPQKNIVKELPANKDNYPFVIGNIDKKFRYNVLFCSDNETFGFHSADEWFDYLKAWRKEIDNPVKITIK